MKKFVVLLAVVVGVLVFAAPVSAAPEPSPLPGYVVGSYSWTEKNLTVTVGYSPCGRPAGVIISDPDPTQVIYAQVIRGHHLVIFTYVPTVVDLDLFLSSRFGLSVDPAAVGVLDADAATYICTG